MTQKNAWENPDPLLTEIADYALAKPQFTDLAYQTAKTCLLDSLGCAMLALQKSNCVQLLGPYVPGIEVADGARVPGTPFVLDPIKAAFDIGTLIRWLDFNDTWLAAEWGHPSDNFGAILAVADYMCRTGQKHQGQTLTMRHVLDAAIKAYEVQGVLALENSFNRVGLDHVVLVKIASTAACCWLWGATREQAISAISNAWVDGQSLRTYRHAPNTGPRKSWAAGDASSRAVRLSIMSIFGGDPGCPQVLSASKWGFSDVLFEGKPLRLARPFESYVMENILFKVSYPAEFHGQTAVECGLRLHEVVKGRIDTIERIEMDTQESAMRIINKSEALNNYADRDHCLQYMAAVALLFGDLKASDYSDEFAAQHPEIDVLRQKMVVRENKQYSVDYLDPNKRAIGNSMQIFFQDGSSSERLEIHYPLGHRQRRAEAQPILKAKYQNALAEQFGKNTAQLSSLSELWEMSDDVFDAIEVDAWMEMWANA